MEDALIFWLGLDQINCQPLPSKCFPSFRLIRWPSQFQLTFMTGRKLNFVRHLILKKWILVQALYANDQFTLEEMHNYRMAVTEREVINGCINVRNVRDHVIIYTRSSGGREKEAFFWPQGKSTESRAERFRFIRERWWNIWIKWTKLKLKLPW